MAALITNDVFLLKGLTSRQRETLTNEDGTPFSLTGRKIFIRLVNIDPVTKVESIVTLIVGAGITVELAAGGVFSWVVTPEQIVELVGDEYVTVYLSIREADDTVVLVSIYNARKTY